MNRGWQNASTAALSKLVLSTYRPPLRGGTSTAGLFISSIYRKRDFGDSTDHGGENAPATALSKLGLSTYRPPSRGGPSTAGLFISPLYRRHDFG